MSSVDKNIVLIGMPGSGKTTIGRIISKELEMGFYDIDEYIEQVTGRTVSEIFKDGEDYFRELEAEAVLKIGEMSPLVIATGGGVIKRKHNIEKLKQKGIIFFIDRPVMNIADDINMNVRPLLKEGTQKLFELYKERYELYKNYSDVCIKNQGQIQDVVKEIIIEYKQYVSN